MPIPVVCPSCATKLRAPDDIAGRKTKCPKCGTGVVVSSPGQEVPEPIRAEPLPQRVKPAEPSALGPKSPPAPAVHEEEDGFDFSPSSRKPARNSSRPGLWIGLGTGVFLFILATIGATLWASGFFSNAKIGQSDPNPPKSKPLPEESEFNDRLSDFIKEGRSVTRMLDLVPDLLAYNKRVDALTELFTRIPDAANERQTAYKKFGQRVIATLGVGSLTIKLRNDFLRLNAQNNAKECDQNCKVLGEQVRYYFDELESSIRVSRLPLSLEELDKKYKK